jgi:hypothetical protein
MTTDRAALVAQRQADRANAKVARAHKLLTEATVIAELIEDWYSAGAIDTLANALADVDVSSQEPRR